MINMVFLAKRGCHCCQRAFATGDMWHCKNDWNEHHNGLKDNDWLNKDEFIRQHGGPEEYYRMVEMLKNPKKYIEKLREKLEEE